jgi:tRNA (mo5U34)-methyltransferase
MNVQHYEHLYASHPDWQEALKPQLDKVLAHPGHGHFPKWKSAYESLSHLSTSSFNFSHPAISIGTPEELDPAESGHIRQHLQTLHPWRKGPFNFFGIDIASEWQCNMKWDRIAPHLNGLDNKRILDVGCGNGYFMLRMLGAGAKTVVGVDPTLVFLAQFYSLTQCLTSPINAHLLPLAFEDLSSQIDNFDYIFSMGVLYHRRDPHEHLQRLFRHTKPGGTVFIETIILDTEETKALIPDDRYAGMRNVWSIPSPNLVQVWLDQCGYTHIQLHNMQKTTVDEQHATPWMSNYSLINFLDKSDLNKTIEGHPAPVRAVFSAIRPN